VCYLLDRGFHLDEALRRHDEVCIFHGTAAEYVQELMEDITDVPENLRFYIDYEAIASDMGYNGEIEVLSRGILVTNALEF
jgi:antirestriction protein